MSLEQLAPGCKLGWAMGSQNASRSGLSQRKTLSVAQPSSKRMTSGCLKSQRSEAERVCIILDSLVTSNRNGLISSIQKEIYQTDTG